MKKKGQAAMEFLMTYGWAILVVIAAIAALAYFGVLDPARLLPERCQFPAGMDCIDKASIKTTTITVALRNNQGFPVTVDSANTTGCTGVPNVYVGASTTPNAIPYATPIPNNEVFRVEFTTCTLVAGDKFDSDVTVGYTNQESSLSNQAVGSVRGRVA
jgi:hypothetical protein